MPVNTLHQPSRGATLSIGYITVGTLLMIWTGVWYWRLTTTAEALPPESLQPLMCLGFFLSGAALVVIGLLLGRIGREAKNADVAVGEVRAATVAPTGNGVAVPTAVPVAQPQPTAAVPVAPQPMETAQAR